MSLYNSLEQCTRHNWHNEWRLLYHNKNIPFVFRTIFKKDLENEFWDQPMHYYYTEQGFNVLTTSIHDMIERMQTHLQSVMSQQKSLTHEEYIAATENYGQSLEYLKQFQGTYDCRELVNQVQDIINAEKGLLNQYHNMDHNRRIDMIGGMSRVGLTPSSPPFKTHEHFKALVEEFLKVFHTLNKNIRDFIAPSMIKRKEQEKKRKNSQSNDTSFVEINGSETTNHELLNNFITVCNDMITFNSQFNSLLDSILKDLNSENVRNLQCLHQLGQESFDLWVNTASVNLKLMHKKITQDFLLGLLQAFINHIRGLLHQAEYQKALNSISEIQATIIKFKEEVAKRCLIVSNQASQILNLNKKFECELFYLVPDLLNKSNITVKAYLLNEEQLNAYLSSDDKSEPPRITFGELNQSKIEFGINKPEKCKVTLKITENPTEKKKDDKDAAAREHVVERKLMILFHGSTVISLNDSEHQAKKPYEDSFHTCSLSLHTLTLPIIKTTHPSQYSEATAVIFWYNTFHDCQETSNTAVSNIFSTKAQVKWNELCPALSSYLYKCTKFELTNGNVEYLKNKLFGVQMPETMISFAKFAKDNVPNKSHTFSDWFFGVIKLIKDVKEVQEMVDKKYIIGFHSMTEVEQMFRSNPNVLCKRGNFVIRFSDSYKSALTFTYPVETPDRTLMMVSQGPLETTDLRYETLYNWMDKYQQLSHLYDGNTLFPKRDWCPDEKIHKVNSVNERYVSKFCNIIFNPVPTIYDDSRDNETDMDFVNIIDSLLEMEESAEARKYQQEYTLPNPNTCVTYACT